MCTVGDEGTPEATLGPPESRAQQPRPKAKPYPEGLPALADVLAREVDGLVGVLHQPGACTHRV